MKVARLLLLLSVCACGTESVELSVQLYSDLVPDVEFASVRWSVDGVWQDDIGGAELERVAIPPLRLGNLRGLSPSATRRVAVSLLSRDGSTLATTEALVDNRIDAEIPITLLRSCVGVVCPGAVSATFTACFGGVCVDPACVTGMEAACPEPQCGSATDCVDAMQACLQASCESGLCVYPQVSNACSDTQYCNPESGCVSRGATCQSGCDDGNPCSMDACDGTECIHEPATPGTRCPGGLCMNTQCLLGLTCMDGLLNGDETGVDCGGSCMACASCSDGMQNQDEMGIDCGGACQACVSPECVGVEEIPARECEALMAVYQSAGGAGWQATDWWQDKQPCAWNGITCSSGRVTGLSVRDDGLSGTISRAVGELTQLTVLSFHPRACCIVSTELSGPIPEEVGQLVQLTQMDIQGNQLTGAIPSSLGNLSNLQTLWLINNKLEGPIPDSLGNLGSLMELILAENQISGSIPVAITNLTDLRSLNLGGNELTGTIPSTIGNLQNLISLSLYGNLLEGAIPPSLGNLPRLTSVAIQQNQLSGLLPETLGNLTTLVGFNIESNQLSGTVPMSFGNLSTLQFLAACPNAGLTADGPTTTFLQSVMNNDWVDGC